MDQILNNLPETVDPTQLILVAAVFLAATMLISSIGKALLGLNSPLSNAASSAVGILFIYVATVAVLSFGGELEPFKPYLSPLPFISINADQLHLFIFEDADAALICEQILSMVVLAFLVNLLDSLIPRGKNIMAWFLFRCATVVLAMLAHWAAKEMITPLLPDAVLENAPAVLLALLALLLAVGSLKLLVGFAIATVNPVIAALYTFFFANFVGKQLTKAALTTSLLAALVWALNKIGLDVISIDPITLSGYMPLLAVLAVVWYIINKILS